MSPVEQFYADLDVQDTVTKRGRKATNMYFTATTEKAIIAYNKETNYALRNKIYREHIDYAFNKLVENNVLSKYPKCRERFNYQKMLLDANNIDKHHTI